jgi:hypothetical protein
MNYITQANLEAYLGSTLTGNGLAMFNLMLPNMQDMIDAYCNRTWNTTNPITEYFDAVRKEGANYIPNTNFVVACPTISTTPYNNLYPGAGGIRSISIAGSLLDMQYVFSYGTYIVIMLTFSSTLFTNPLGLRAVQIVYNSDAAGSPPKPIQQALIEWIARKIQNSGDSGKEAILVRTGEVEARYKPDMTPGIPDFVKTVLDQFRLPVVDRF